jgi:hypothetical protein
VVEGTRRSRPPNDPKRLDLMDRCVKFDVLFTDSIMPDGINGRQLAVKIDNRRPGGPAVHPSGYPENLIIPRLDLRLPGSASRAGRPRLPSPFSRQFAHLASNASMNERSHRPSRMACIVASSRAR